MQRSELLKAWSRFSMSRHLKVKCLIPSFKISLKDMTTTGYAVFQITNLVWISNSDFRLVDKTLKRNISKVLTYVYLCIQVMSGYLDIVVKGWVYPFKFMYVYERIPGYWSAGLECIHVDLCTYMSGYLEIVVHGWSISMYIYVRIWEDTWILKCRVGVCDCIFNK